MPAMRNCPGSRDDLERGLAFIAHRTKEIGERGIRWLIAGCRHIFHSVW